MLRQHQPQLAIEKFQRALRVLPDDDILQGNLAAAYLFSGVAALNERKFDAALEFFLAGRRYANDDYRFPYFTGYAYLKQGALSQAEVALNDSLGIAPDQPDVYALLGRLYYDSGRMSEALDSLNKALELQPDDQSVQNLLRKVEQEYAVEGSMDQEHGGHFSVSYQGEANAELGEAVLQVLDEAYVEIGTWMNSFPDLRIPVLLYSREDFSAITGSPDWVAGTYDGKIRIPLGGVSQINQQLRALLFHEYSHVVTRQLTRGQCPAWVHEGLAELFGRDQYGPPLQQLPEALQNDRLLDFQNLETSLSQKSTDDVQLAYEQSYHFIHYLVDYFGWHVMADLLAAYADGATTEAAFAQAFGAYALDFTTIVTQWQASARLEL